DRPRIGGDAEVGRPVHVDADARRRDEGLRRHAVVEHAGAAHAVALHDRDVAAVLGCHQSGLVARWAAAHDHDPRHRRTPFLVRSVPEHRTREAALYSVAVPLYAAYGSNMDPAQMKERAPHSPMAGTGWLMGWRLTFGGEDFAWEGALSTVVEDPASQVFVVLYDVPDHDAAQLDRWEGGELGLHKKLRL